MKYQTLDGTMASASELYQAHIKGDWQKISTMPYQSKSIVVKLNLAQSKKEADVWIKVKLLFVRGVNEDKEQAGKHDWALFLSTDSQLSDETILEIYALRWGIEVLLFKCIHYFNASKILPEWLCVLLKYGCVIIFSAARIMTVIVFAFLQKKKQKR